MTRNEKEKYQGNNAIFSKYEEIKDMVPEQPKPSISELIKECEDIIENPTKTDNEPLVSFED